MREAGISIKPECIRGGAGGVRGRVSWQMRILMVATLRYENLNRFCCQRKNATSEMKSDDEAPDGEGGGTWGGGEWKFTVFRLYTITSIAVIYLGTWIFALRAFRQKKHINLQGKKCLRNRRNVWRARDKLISFKAITFNVLQTVIDSIVAVLNQHLKSYTLCTVWLGCALPMPGHARHCYFCQATCVLRHILSCVCLSLKRTKFSSSSSSWNKFRCADFSNSTQWIEWLSNNDEMRFNLVDFVQIMVLAEEEEEEWYWQIRWWWHALTQHQKRKIGKKQIKIGSTCRHHSHSSSQHLFSRSNSGIRWHYFSFACTKASVQRSPFTAMQCNVMMLLI